MSPVTVLVVMLPSGLILLAEVGETNVLRDFVAQVGGINHARMFIRVGAIRCVAEEDERRTGFYGTAHDFFIISKALTWIGWRSGLFSQRR